MFLWWEEFFVANGIAAQSAAAEILIDYQHFFDNDDATLEECIFSYWPKVFWLLGYRSRFGMHCASASRRIAFYYQNVQRMLSCIHFCLPTPLRQQDEYFRLLIDR